MTEQNASSRMDAMRKIVAKQLQSLGISAREASRRIPGANVGYVGDFLSGRSKTPEADRIMALAEAIELPVAALIGEDAPGGLIATRIAPPPPPRGDVPLYAARLVLNRAILAIEAVPNRSAPGIYATDGVAGAFAVTVPNEQNAPRYLPGETAYVSPDAMVRPGDFVFARFGVAEAGIFRLDSITDDEFVLSTIAEPESVRRPIVEVTLYKVVACVSA
jgi:hypothetical protein